MMETKYKSNDEALKTTGKMLRTVQNQLDRTEGEVKSLQAESDSAKNQLSDALKGLKQYEDENVSLADKVQGAPSKPRFAATRLYYDRPTHRSSAFRGVRARRAG